MLTRQKFDLKIAENLSNIKKFRIFFLEIAKYHQNTCLCEILAQLEHVLGQYRHFKAFLRPFLPYFPLIIV